ncbi:hypothetical protein ABFX02_05G074200 [Erythranthe guttata]
MISHSSILRFFRSTKNLIRNPGFGYIFRRLSSRFSKNLINNPGFDYVFGCMSCICNSTFKNINCFFADANTRISCSRIFCKKLRLSVRDWTWFWSRQIGGKG